MSEYQRTYWERARLEKRRTPVHPVIRAYVEPKIEVIRRHVALGPDTRLLDAGCGNGFFTHYFASLCDTTGVDYSAMMLRMNPVAKRGQMDVRQMAFADDSFDVVFCHGLLHHVDDMDRVVSEMRRVSRRHVVILEPNRWNPFVLAFSMLVAEERQGLRFSPAFLDGLVRRNGLAPVYRFGHGAIVPNKTPEFMLPLVRLLDGEQPFGVINGVIAEKV